MKKQEILEQLKQLNIKKEDYIIIGDTALVLQDIIEESEVISLSCSNIIDKDPNWKKKGISTDPIKNKIEIFTDFDFKDNIINFEGYKVLNLEGCYLMKKKEGKKQDKKVIEKLDLILCSTDNTRYEKKLRDKGIRLIAGVDEVGRGPLVGPVVAACVILPEKFNLEGLTDSKKLSEKKRNDLFEEINRQAVSIGIGIIDEKKIDEVNIYEATKMAMKKAIENSAIKPEHILIDAMPLNINIPTTSIIKGDLKSITISAASVIAKVTRDTMLYELDKQYPMYDFKNNKGYPTKKHLKAIEKYGIIDKHRQSYEPVKKYLEKTQKIS